MVIVLLFVAFAVVWKLSLGYTIEALSDQVGLCS